VSALYLGARVQRVVWVAAGLCVLACGLAMTGSRMAMLFAVLIIGLLFTPTALRPTSIQHRWVAAGALVAGYAAGLIALRLVVGQFDTVTRIGEDTLPLRMELWKQAWQIAWQHPWLGVGVGQFGYGQYWVARPGPYLVPASNGHNLILQLAAELGWPAAIGAVALGLYWGLRDLRARLTRPEYAVSLAMMLMILIHSMLEYPLWHLYFAIPAALLFAMAEPEPGARVARFGVRLFLPGWGLVMVAVALAFHVHYGPVSAAGAPLWRSSQNLGNPTGAEISALYAVAGSALFQPEVDRLMLVLSHAADEGTGGQLQRAERSLHVLATPEVIAQYVAQLARAGRIEDAMVHLGRLRVFAGGRYEGYRDQLLDQTRDLGPQTAPLRHALREAK